MGIIFNIGLFRNTILFGSSLSYSPDAFSSLAQLNQHSKVDKRRSKWLIADKTFLCEEVSATCLSSRHALFGPVCTI